MYIRFNLECDCGSHFDIDTDNNVDKCVICPNCGKIGAILENSPTFLSMLKTINGFDDTKYSFKFRSAKLSKRDH